MDPISLFDIANKQADWLAARQKAVASNVANANTPGYKARDVQAFGDVLNNNTFAMTVTNSKHMDVTDNGMEAHDMRPKDTIETTHSGNNVNLEDEMRKGGEIGQDMSLNTVIVKAFHRMMMAAVKGGA
ncbi:flagellar basal body rod protein FlgB [uncultured Bartonella sp.]|uniref:flagellar basal body rod protein FlgB n=1 Tax=uncultured Bartonella sp. TaxID=104108 RepID=UPI002625E15C|nr:flagellar basal body rod protein FlgB [uncultured Bartonella sp.]